MNSSITPSPGLPPAKARPASRAACGSYPPSEGITPGSAAAQAVLDRIVGPETAPAQRASMLEQLETFTDARVERSWQLVGIINGRPPLPSAVPAFEWVIAALRAHARPDIR